MFGHALFRSVEPYMSRNSRSLKFQFFDPENNFFSPTHFAVSFRTIESAHVTKKAAHLALHGVLRVCFSKEKAQL